MSASCAATSGLRDSGFLMIQIPMLLLELQKRVLKVTSQFLEPLGPLFSLYSAIVTMHHFKITAYIMVEGIKLLDLLHADDSTGNSTIAVVDLKEWNSGLQRTKDALLRCIAIGPGVDNPPEFFTNSHDADTPRYNSCATSPLATGKQEINAWSTWTTGLYC